MQTDDDRNGPQKFEFGWWPEILGVTLTIGLVTYLLAMARGSF